MSVVTVCDVCGEKIKFAEKSYKLRVRGLMFGASDICKLCFKAIKDVVEEVKNEAD